MQDEGGRFVVEVKSMLDILYIISTILLLIFMCVQKQMRTSYSSIGP